MQTECIYDCTPSFVHSCVLNASRFTGKEHDTESGLDNFGARYYSSSMGRFASPDPYEIVIRKNQGKSANQQKQLLESTSQIRRLGTSMPTV
jgi:RHS repeat-associated protein